jgi:(R)-2-hydroxyglutarate---pyruvate transhydrogenase
MAESEAQKQSLWSFRESIPEACARDGSGGNLKYDLSVPVPQLYKTVENIRKRLEQDLNLYGKNSGRIGSVVGFGHMVIMLIIYYLLCLKSFTNLKGDGNLHLNITGAANDEVVVNAVEPYVYEWVKSQSGSISAEHGMGVMKAPYISYSKSDEAISIMKSIKNLWDPKGILNPYKFLP